jgi:hypothetical protein
MKDTSCLEWDGFHATEHACATSAHALGGYQCFVYGVPGLRRRGCQDQV